MSSSDDRPTGSRQRPSYGLPGPEGQQPGADPGAGSGADPGGGSGAGPGGYSPSFPPSGSSPQQGHGSGDFSSPNSYGAGNQYGAPSGDPFGSPSPNGGQYGGSSPDGGLYGAPGAGSPTGQFGESGTGPSGGPFGVPPGQAGGPGGPGGPGAQQGYAVPPQQKRRGLLPLILGIVLMIIIAPVVGVVGIVWGGSSIASSAGSGPVQMENGTVEMELESWDMVQIYVPEADADAECSIQAENPNAIQAVDGTGQELPAPDGTTYTDSVSAVATEDTTVTVTCEGTDAPAYIGPMSMTSMILPMLIGVGIALVAGLVGLILTIVGIVLLVKTRRKA